MIDFNQPLTVDVKDRIAKYASTAKLNREDATQEFILKCLELQDKYDPSEGDFLGYVYKSLTLDISKTAPRYFDDSFHKEGDEQFENIASNTGDYLEQLELAEIKRRKELALEYFDREMLKRVLSKDKSKPIGDRRLRQIIAKCEERNKLADIVKNVIRDKEGNLIAMSDLILA